MQPPKVVVAILLLALPSSLGVSPHRDGHMVPRAIEKRIRHLHVNQQRDPQVLHHSEEKEEKLLLLKRELLSQIEDARSEEYFDQICQELGCSRANQHDLIALIHLQAMERNLTEYVHAAVDASWDYNTDVNAGTASAMEAASVELSMAYNFWWTILLEPYSYENLTVPWIKRQFELQQSIGTAILEGEYLTDYTSVLTEMSDAYTNKICPYEEGDCDEDEDGLDIDALEKEMAEVRDYSELNYYWAEWREVSGNEVLDEYHDYVFLMNLAATMNGFKDAGEMWLKPYVGGNYTVQDFKLEIASLWNQLAEFYELFHGYVRYKLKNYEDYEDEFENDDDPIPASILGNMWAQDWGNIYDIVQPFRETIIDITEALDDHSSEIEMFKMAEDFFVSLGLFPMTEDFWNNSLLVQPDDRVVMCHASAWDFYSKEPYIPRDGEFRIKMCTSKTQDDFITVHHEMGHTEYQMSYAVFRNTSQEEKPQLVNPIVYRDGANPGFHEAIGDTIALSVSTQSHLSMIEANLTGQESSQADLTYEETINFLMKQALSKIAFLPYAYILDQWRWEVFAGDIPNSEYNYAWWKKRLTYQGLRPPVPRSSDTDFDIGCKYHVLANVPYIRYFVAHILQFQFHERLCELAGMGDVDIFNCDIYGSKEAGKALYDMMKNGKSIPWQKQLADFLGTEGKMNASAILHYFEPLIDFLKGEVERLDITLGWPTSDNYLDEYIAETEDISPIVPFIVGLTLAIMVLLVLIAFIVGNARRRNDTEREIEERDVPEKGKSNKSFEMEEDKDIEAPPPPKDQKEEKISSFPVKQDAPQTSSQPEIVITEPDGKEERGAQAVTPGDARKSGEFDVSPFDEIDAGDRRERAGSKSSSEDPRPEEERGPQRIQEVKEGERKDSL